jgi:autotransporter translocation and assembly factor TamB
MRRHIGRLTAAFLIALIPAVLGTLTALLYTGAGNDALGRIAGRELSHLLRGRFEIEHVSGSFIQSIQLDNLIIRDTLGQPFAHVPRLRVRYSPANLLAGRFVLLSAELEQPDIRIVKRQNGRLNYQEILRLGEGTGTGPSPLIEFRDIRIRRGHIQLRLPWTPPDTAKTSELVAAALAEDRAKPGRVVLNTPDGLRRVVELEALNVRIPVLRVSSPDRAPLTMDLDSLSTRVSDPAVQVVDLAAHLWTHDDSLAFTAHRASLPNSRMSGGGVLTWPKGPVLYDFTLDAPRIDLRDFHWISPAFADLTGHAIVTARSRSDQLTAYTLQDLDLQGPLGRVRGSVTALTDQHRGLGVEDMALDLTNLDLDVPRPYFDTLPLHGTLSGQLRGAGFKDGLDLDADLAFEDRTVDGGASSTLAGTGHLILGGPEGTILDTMLVAAADIDLRSVQVLVPAVRLQGRLEVAGTLKGPWRNVTFAGDLTHRDENHPQSHASGTATLDTRADLFRFQTRMTMAPLAFDGVRPSYPSIPLQGAVTGLIAAEGTPDRFHLTTDVQGDIGTLTLAGTIAQDSTRIAAESLTATFAKLDVARVRGSGPHTSLNGKLRMDGVFDTLVGPTGTLALDLAGGRIMEFPVDSIHSVLRGFDAQVAADTVLLYWPGGRVGGKGALNWRERGDRQIRVEFEADSLEPLEPVLERLSGLPADSAAEAQPIHGQLTGELTLSGSWAEPRLVGWTRGEDLHWRGVRAPTAATSFGWNMAPRSEIGASLRVDSLFIGKWELRDLDGTLGGYQDSLLWRADGSLDEMASVASAGEWRTVDDRMVIQIDSLVANLPRHEWRLQAPATVTADSARFVLSPIALQASDGSGSVLFRGSVPRAGAGALEVNAFGIDLRDVYGLLELDTAGIAGTIQTDLTIGGTADRPSLQGAGSFADLSFGEFGSPYVQAVFNYGERRLQTNLLLWKTGQPVLRMEAELPLDLALKTLPRRQVPGPITVRIIADSTDLGVVEAFTPNLRRVRGMLRADVQIGGTWEEPRLGGQLQVVGASANVPGLGVRYEAVNAAAHLSGDTVLVDSVTAKSGEGSIRATGGIWLDRLTRPVLNLTFRARRFQTIDVRRFLTLDASGTVRLTGPVFGAHLTGRMTADVGNLHFADLLTKRIVDLENPGDSGLIDLDLIRTERLGANFQSRFLDSLTIDTLQIQMGEGFWLRSSEANIQLDGEMTVKKVRDRYRYDGTLNAVRGNYTLRIGGIVTRDFSVDRGTVRYFGTPDLNADLDIEASHKVIAAETNEEIPVIARITGTMLQPKLELLSPPTSQRPALSQTELVSYLMFGRPTFSLQGQGTQSSQYAAVQAGVSYLASAFSSELQRTLISDLGVPIDFLDIRTGGAGTSAFGGQSGTAQVAQVAAGWQIGRKWFVSLVADLCTNTQRFYPNAEFRMSRQLRLKTSVEPAYTCQAAQFKPDLSTSKYQVGLDVLWDREY